MSVNKMSLADWQNEYQRQKVERFFTEDIAMFGKPWIRLTDVEKGQLYFAHVERDSEYFNPGDITAGACLSIARCIFDTGALITAGLRRGGKKTGESKKAQGEQTRLKVLTECGRLKVAGKSPQDFAGIIEQQGWLSASQVRRILAKGKKTRMN